MFIRTVAGDIKPEDLGFTHCHEHLFTGRIEGVDVEKHLILDSLRRSKREARRYVRQGGSGLVDAQPFGAGRDAMALKNISLSTGLHIVSATGFHKTMFYPEHSWVETADKEEVADLLVSEITEGMYEYHSRIPSTGGAV